MNLYEIQYDFNKSKQIAGREYKLAEEAVKKDAKIISIAGICICVCLWIYVAFNAF